MARKYQAYSEHKDSGAEWLGVVPKHWKLKRFKFVANARKGKLPKKIVAYEAGVFPPYLTMDYLRTGCAENFVDDKDATPINDNEALLLWDGANAGEFIKSRYGVISSTVAHIKFIDQHNEQFCWHFAKLLEIQLRTSTVGMGIPHVSGDNLNNLIFCEPPKSEQETIANFLDHETAKIDTLIEKQQQLIKLLKEKRQAVISHAVTKGLNPNALMRDSGVEWLGEVPAHWTLKNYRYATKIYRGKFGHRPRNDPAFYDGDYPFIQTGDIARAGKKITTYTQTLNKKGVSVSQMFPTGTLVMAIAANIGDTAILDFEAYAPDSVVGFRPNQDIDLEYLRYSFLAALPALEQTSTQSTQANLNIDRISILKATFPPLSEQIAIVGELDKIIEKHGNLEAKAMEAIVLMQERRTALISAAVTGKIDVRDWQAPNV